MGPHSDVRFALEAAGVEIPRSIEDDATEPGVERLARSVREGVLPLPVVAKVVAPQVAHKTEIGGVRLGLLSEEQVRRALTELREVVAELGLSGASLRLEEQVAGGVELLVGSTPVPGYGEVMAVGAGGVLAEAWSDVTYHFGRIDDLDVARDLLARLRCMEVARRRGLVADAGIEAAASSIVALSSIAGSYAGIEVNPLVLGTRRCVAVDVTDYGPREAAQALRDPVAPEVVEALLSPRAVAVVGASSSGRGLGHQILSRIVEFGYQGSLHAVHPSAEQIAGVPCVAKLEDVPGGVDLAIVAVGADAAIEVVEGAAAAKVVHVVASGFAESGVEGSEREAELLAAGRRSGSRILGPNCMGVHNPSRRLTFLAGAPDRPGSIRIVSQSGGLTSDIVRLAEDRKAGVAWAVSLGNAVDISPADLVRAAVDEQDTSVVGVYLESDRFLAELDEAWRPRPGRPPVVVLRGGRTSAGARVAASHTGAIVGRPELWDAYCRQRGLVAVDTVDELVDVSDYLQRYGAGDAADPGAVVLGAGGGTSVLAADAASRSGVALRRLPLESVEMLEALDLGSGTQLGNPIDLPQGALTAMIPGRDGTGRRAMAVVLDRLLEREPGGDWVVHINIGNLISPDGSTGADLDGLLDDLLAVRAVWPQRRLSLVVRNPSLAPGPVAAVVELARSSGLPTFTDLPHALTCVASSRPEQQHTSPEQRNNRR